jgi:hypothetical protein
MKLLHEVVGAVQLSGHRLSEYSSSYGREFLRASQVSLESLRSSRLSQLGGHVQVALTRRAAAESRTFDQPSNWL